MNLFSLSVDEVIKALNNPVKTCFDALKNSKIYICTIRGKLYSVVVRQDVVITLYRTDETKLYSRIRSGRWNCE
ncbi:MAG: hypothetical protein D6699_04900 [Aquificota bacterium]|nr:MAG: hypothetical protein D6699_04900 [Aquificota bacterium]